MEIGHYSQSQRPQSTLSATPNRPCKNPPVEVEEAERPDESQQSPSSTPRADDHTSQRLAALEKNPRGSHCSCDPTEAQNKRSLTRSRQLFTKEKQHYLTFESKGSFAFIKMHKSQYRLAVATLKVSSGRDVERFVE